MANISKIADRIWTGGDLPPDDRAGDDVADWRAAGITHIVDSRLEWSDEDFVAQIAPDIAYFHNGADDVGGRQPDEWFDRGVGWVLDALDDPDAQVLIHCHMGINRGPSMAYAVLIALGWDPIQAIDAIRTARPIAAVGYAEDALDWHHRKIQASRPQRAEGRRGLAAWRRDHHIDVVRIIRGIRAAEDADRVA